MKNSYKKDEFTDESILKTYELLGLIEQESRDKFNTLAMLHKKSIPDQINVITDNTTITKHDEDEKNA